MTKAHFLIIGAMGFGSSCTSPMPAGYWEGFKSAAIATVQSDQGGHAGYRAIHWIANENDFFTADEVIAFAQENDWPLIDSTAYSAASIQCWAYAGQPIFPLGFNGFDPRAGGEESYRCFPRWINTDLVIYKFKTPWLTVVEGEWQDAMGYAVISADSRQMALYHLWGDKANLVLP